MKTIVCHLLILSAFSSLHAQYVPRADAPEHTGLFIALRGVITPGFDVRHRGFSSTGTDTTFVDPSDGGGGFGIHIGWGITNWLTLHGGFDLTGHDVQGPRYNHSSITHIELGLRLQLPSDTFSPFLLLSYGSRSFSMSRQTQSGNVITIYREFPSVDAGTISFGGGVRFWILDLSYMVSSTSYPDEQVEEFTTSRFQIGLVWWFDLS